MKFHTTLSIPQHDITVGTAEEITEDIRELGFPGPGSPAYSLQDGNLVWDCEFEGNTLDEIAGRFSETADKVRTYVYHTTWTANPDDPIEHAQRTARDVLDWEKAFDGIDLGDDLREALTKIAGEEL